MNVVITGASRGIGLELVRQYLARGDTVLATARTAATAGQLQALAAANGERLRVTECDVTVEESVRALAEAATAPVHRLLNNAGVRTPIEGREAAEGLEAFDPNDALSMFQVNALGALRVTRALLSHLRRAGGAKVVNVTSGLGSIANTSGGGYGYRLSKAALNMASRTMALDLGAAGISVMALSPGWVRTEMGGSAAPLGPSESAAGIVAVVEGAALEDTGTFLDYQGIPIPW